MKSYKTPEADLVLLTADPLVASDDNELSEKDDVTMSIADPVIGNI